MPIYTENKVALVDTETGEAIALWDGPQVITVRTKESHLQAMKHADKPLVSSVPGRRSLEKDLGGDFLWTIFDTSKTLFPAIKPATLSRLMILSTYMNYENELVDGKGNPLTQHDMSDILKVTYRMIRYTVDELTAGMMLTYDGVFKLNDAMFARGQLNKKELGIVYHNSKTIKRLYIQGIRALYDSANAGSIKKLSYIFRIMPFVNQEYNIVCENPLEKNKMLIRPLSVGDLADIIGYGRKNAAKLQDMLLDPTFDVGNGPTKAVRYVSGDKLGIENHCLFINPEIYYGGNSCKEVEVLERFK